MAEHFFAGLTEFDVRLVIRRYTGRPLRDLRIEAGVRVAFPEQLSGVQLSQEMAAALDELHRMSNRARDRSGSTDEPG